MFVLPKECIQHLALFIKESKQFGLFKRTCSLNNEVLEEVVVVYKKQIIPATRRYDSSMFENIEDLTVKRGSLQPHCNDDEPIINEWFRGGHTSYRAWWFTDGICSDRNGKPNYVIVNNNSAVCYWRGDNNEHLSSVHYCLFGETYFSNIAGCGWVDDVSDEQIAVFKQTLASLPSVFTPPNFSH